MLEEGAHDRRNEASGARDPRDRRPQAELKTIGHLAGSFTRGLDGALVAPPGQREHRGVLLEATPRLALDQPDVIVLDREPPEELHPASPERLPQRDALDVQVVAELRRHGHLEPGTELVVHSVDGHHPRPDLTSRGRETGRDEDLMR